MEFYQTILDSKLRNVKSVARYSGVYCIRTEYLPEHIIDGALIGLEIRKYIQKTNDVDIDQKEIVWKFFMHDFDEAIYCDIPRKFKYYNQEIRLAIKNTVDSILFDELDKETISEIDNAKNVSTIEGLICYVTDPIQAAFKMHEEYIVLGNRSFKQVVDELENYFNHLIEYINYLDYPDGIKLSLVEILTSVQKLFNKN